MCIYILSIYMYIHIGDASIYVRRCESLYRLFCLLEYINLSISLYIHMYLYTSIYLYLYINLSIYTCMHTCLPLGPPLAPPRASLPDSHGS